MSSGIDDVVDILPKLRPRLFVQILSEVTDYAHEMMNIPEMWKRTKGAGYRCVILDSGIPDHPDLDFDAKKCASFVPGYSIDSCGHSTHCGGIIAATAGNSMGVAGIAPEVEDLYGAVLNGAGQGSVRWIVNGIRWAVDVAGADLISMSLGMPDGMPHMKEMEDACNYAASQGVTVVAASGNEYGRVGQPARYDSVIAVAAVDSKKEHAKFSNTGPQVDFATAGVDVYSTYLRKGYAKLSGTCLAKGTYIYTPTGPKKIEEVKVGDKVYAYKDDAIVVRTVTANLYQGKNTVHHLRAAGRDVWATETHRFLVFNTATRAVEWVELRHLESKHRLLIPVGFDCEVNTYLDEAIPEEFAWLLGFFLGDGWISATTRCAQRVCFANGIETDVMDRVRAAYEKFVGKQLTNNKDGNWSYDDSTKAAAVITTLGLNAKAANKTLPAWLWTVSAPKRSAFYRGYLAADGHDGLSDIYAHPRKSFECASYDLMRRLAILADYNGWQHSVVNQRERTCQPPGSPAPVHATSYCLSIGEGAPKQGFSCLKSTTSSDGATAEVPGANRAHLFGVDSTRFSTASWKIDEDTCETDVYDLTVPDADCFIAHGLIAHNSMAAPALAGVACLLGAEYKATHGGKRPGVDEIRRRLAKIAYDVGADGFDDLYGNGIPIFRPGIDWDAPDAQPAPAPATPPVSSTPAEPPNIIPVPSTPSPRRPDPCRSFRSAAAAGLAVAAAGVREGHDPADVLANALEKASELFRRSAGVQP